MYIGFGLRDVAVPISTSAARIVCLIDLHDREMNEITRRPTDLTNNYRTRDVIYQIYDIQNKSSNDISIGITYANQLIFITNYMLKQVSMILKLNKYQLFHYIKDIVNCQNTRDMESPECNGGPWTYHNDISHHIPSYQQR